MTAEDQPFGLMFGAALPASELEERQIVVLDGYVTRVESDPDDPALARLTLVRALGPPPGTDPDRRAMVLICPRDMVFGTAAPHNVDLAPAP
jgi:hypothetical protein